MNDTKPNHTIRRLVLLMIVLLPALYAAHLWAACTTYEDSKVVIIAGEPYCALSGYTCVECVYSNGTVCVTISNTCDQSIPDGMPSV